MADLVLGNQPEKLTVNLVPGDPISFSLTLKSAGVPVAWPSAPVLEFAASSWTSTLDGTGSVATWTEDEAAVGVVLAASSKKVRLSVDGATWWAGSAVKRG